MTSAGNGQRISPVAMQSAVGLMLLATAGALIFLLLWLRNFAFGGRSYNATIVFPNAGGMTIGTRVAYRGVAVGKVRKINPEPDGVNVNVEISPADRLIPSNARIEATQAGLVGETTIDITPLQSLSPQQIQGNPLDANCDPKVIICNGSRLQGLGTLDVNTLIRSLVKISNLISDPEVTASIRSIAQRSSVALGKLGNLGELSAEATELLKQANQTGSIRNLNRTLRSINQAAGDVSQLSGDVRGFANSLDLDGVNSLNATLNEARNALLSVGQAADQVRLFMLLNQDRLSGTLDSISRTSNQLGVTVTRLDPVIDDLQHSELLKNLEVMSSNAVDISENLDDITTQLNDPKTILKLQQILDSARMVFENVEKITSDIDQLTGDPKLRQDLIRLIQGLSSLVSSTQHLHQQVVYGQSLNQMAGEIAAIEPIQKNQP